MIGSEDATGRSRKPETVSVAHLRCTKFPRRGWELFFTLVISSGIGALAQTEGA